MGLEKFIEKLEENYTVDKTEFGKVLLIASAALFVVSLHSALVIDGAVNELQGVENQLEKTEAIINSESFQDSLEAIQSIQGTEIGPQFTQAANAFEEAQSGVNRTEAARESLEQSYTNYQWLVLLSILGAVTGISIIYVL